jgi:putative colanic acid biosynthesis glycosyltransferase
MRILQINTTVNSGSTGRIAEDIGKTLISAGHESYIAFGRGRQKSKSNLIKIGGKLDFYLHVIRSLFTDRHGFGSKRATRKFLKQVDVIKPDAIGLHNIHGYYLNIELLFKYIKDKNIPILWTFHDCWPFTGHCSYNTDCDNCKNCQRKYPTSIFLNQSSRNYNDKKMIFNQVKKLEIVTPSIWLKDLANQSFLKHPVQCINNGIDLNQFQPSENYKKLKEKLHFKNKKIILGVASTWDKRKGLSDFIQLALLLDANYQIILIGLSSKQIQGLPVNIMGLQRTESTAELALYYSMAAVYINPTSKDNFPTTNIESLGCGTPVVTYDTGGSPEAINDDTGKVVQKGDVKGLCNAIQELALESREQYAKLCRTRAELLFNKDERYLDYLKLYERLIN